MLIRKKTVGSIAFMGGLPAVLTQFAWDYARMVEFNSTELLRPSERIHYMKSDVSQHARARNDLVHDMRGDWLFMLDTDHTFSPDICQRLLRIMMQYNVDVVSGLYQYKIPPYSPVLHMWNEESGAFSMLGKWQTEGEIFPIGGGGGGCLLIKKIVFQRIYNELKELPFECLPMRDGNRNLGEDMSFFRRCARLGIKVWCAPSVRANHLRIAPVTWDDYRPDELSMSRIKEMESIAD